MFGKRLRELRKEKNLSQADVAKLLGVTQQAVGNYESGSRDPDTATLTKLAGYFDCSVDYLLGRTDIRKFSLDIENIAAMRSKELEGYEELPDDAKKMLQAIVKEYYERFGKKKGKSE